MKADKRFLNQPLDFWANIKLISQKAGYTDKKTKHIKVHTLEEIKKVYESNNLNYSKVIDSMISLPHTEISLFHIYNIGPMFYDMKSNLA